jgi:CRISPR-associated protein Cmr6
MIQSRRKALRGLQPSSHAHAGLWLDKYIAGQLQPDEKIERDTETPQHRLVREVSQLAEPAEYRSFYNRWKSALAEHTRFMGEAKVRGRMIVDIGAESVLETSVALHHTYGVPYIPGSALKGLAASFARQYLDSQQWGAESYSYKKLFGTTEEAGHITFYDALYKPGSGVVGRALHPDVLTVHHPKYYQQTPGPHADIPPAEWDSPTPVPFLTATGSYLVALSAPEGWEEWVTAAFNMLSLALATMGVGAKTSSGYGRMALQLMVDSTASATSPKRAHGANSPHYGPAGTSTADASNAPSTPRAPGMTLEERQQAVRLKLRELGKEPLLYVNSIEPDGSVLLQIPGFGADVAVGIIKVSDLLGKQFQARTQARVKVLATHIDPGGRIVVELVPVIKERK